MREMIEARAANAAVPVASPNNKPVEHGKRVVKRVDEASGELIKTLR